MIFNGLTKRDTSALKGFAILCIVFHNFFHWMTPSPGENEFVFYSGCVHNFFRLLGEQPSEFINIIFSYLGHYGVQIFVLLSGYGLAVSMLRHEKDWTTFIVDRLKKLYPLLLTAIIVFILFVIVNEHRFLKTYDWTETWQKLLFIHTLIPNSGLSLNGPWWFFALIFQLYLLFPLLFRFIRKHDWKAFATVCVISYTLIFLFRNAFDMFHGEIIMMNAPGHLPEFCLGILLAQHQNEKIHPAWLILAVAVFCLGNFYAVFYPFTFLAVSIIVLFAYQGAKKLPHKKGWTANAMIYFGDISMVLFAIHGFFRTPFLNMATPDKGFWNHALFFVLFFITVWGASLAAKHLYDGLVRLFGLIKIRESKASHIVGTVLQTAIGLFFAYIISYYISLNTKKFEKTVERYETKINEAIIKSDWTYFNIAQVNFDKKQSSINIEGSFDIMSMDTTKELPLFIIQISDKYWQRFTIPEKFNTSKCNKYEFSYRFDCPFYQNLNGKTIKLFFWNTKNTTIQVKDLDLSIKY